MCESTAFKQCLIYTTINARAGRFFDVPHLIAANNDKACRSTPPRTKSSKIPEEASGIVLDSKIGIA
jgi:hypothetical protein